MRRETTTTTSDIVMRRLGGLSLILIGLTIGVGGVWLAALHGTFYYAVAGAMLIVSGGLVMRGSRAGVYVYAIAFSVSVIWSLYEVGPDVWLLLPRLDGPIVIGLAFLVPSAWRWLCARLRTHMPVMTRSRIWSRHSCAAGTAAVLLIMVVVSSRTEAPAASHVAPSATAGTEWRHYGGTLKGQRYAAVGQITPDNADKLRVAWTYHTGDGPSAEEPAASTFEATPIKIRDTLYFCSPHNSVIALDAETGKERWRHVTPGTPRSMLVLTCRGVAYHEDETANGPCARRIIAAAPGARLIALDADSGTLCRDFGENGLVDLAPGLGKFSRSNYVVTSAPTIVGNVAVVGAQVYKDQSADEIPGVVRAFDVKTGALVWNWDADAPDDTTPRTGGARYSLSSPNAWGPPSVDESLGLIYLPTAADAWEDDSKAHGARFSSSIVALDAATGKLRWSYQTVHHDVWDMDVGAQPTLTDIRTADGVKPAVMAVTKRGDIFLLDRRTGQPIVAAAERSVPVGEDAGASPRQPFSDLTFQPRTLTETDMWGVTPLDQLWCRIQFRRYSYDGIFTPQTASGIGSIVYPGHYGVFNWGGAAVDEPRQVMIVNPSYVPFYSHLVPRGEQRQRVAEASGDKTASDVRAKSSFHPSYFADVGAFLSPLGIPCNAPPWGELAAVDLATKQILWRHKVGTTRDRNPLGLALPLGVPSMGGSIVTKGGVTFIAGAIDDYLRAFDTETGHELWKGRLPAGGQATPMTYVSAISGRQFVVVAAGGHGGIGTTRGDSLVGFALGH